MVDVPMLPVKDEDNQVVHTIAVPANQMTIAQQRMAHAVWQSIQSARHNQRIMTIKLQKLEARFDYLESERNNAYRRITHDTEGGMKFLYEHLHSISIQASQFSGLVHQQITKTAEGDAKIVTVQVTNQINNGDL